MAAILDFRKPHVLRNEEEYSAAVERVDKLLRLDIDDGSEEAEELLFLSVLIEEYEDREHSIEGATPQEVVVFALDQRGMPRSELAEVMGGWLSRVRLLPWEAGALQEPGSRASRNAADTSGAAARLRRGWRAQLGTQTGPGRLRRARFEV
jgi:antitoxin component HigA of HigAB toxin-antitoxin module